jgi:hypothetical protein
MSNYSKTTNFGAKNSLVAGTADKKLDGSEFEVEFDAIQTAIATKSDSASPAFTGTATAQSLTVSGTTTVAGTLSGTFTIDGGTF